MSANCEKPRYIQKERKKFDWRRLGGPTKYQQAMDQFLSRCKWNCMVTLTFSPRGGRVSRVQAEARFGRLIRSLGLKKFGSKSRRKIANASFIEQTTNEVPHIHSMMKLGGTAEENRKLLRALWTKVHSSCGDPSEHDKGGEKWYVEIIDEENRGRLRRYVAKECMENGENFLDKYAYFGPVRPV